MTIGIAPGLPRAAVNSSKLVHALASLGLVEVAESKQTFGERLGLWLDWTDAVALSAALKGGGEGRAAPARGGTSSSADALAETLARVHQRLTRAITTDELLTAGRDGGQRPGAAHGGDADADVARYRRCHVMHQQAMDRDLRPLRAELRAALSNRSPALGRLAALDAVMEAALAARERELLATVPAWLERHFERLRDGATGSPADGLAGYGQDLQRVLLAELDLRWQPIEGLMQALRREDDPRS